MEMHGTDNTNQTSTGKQTSEATLPYGLNPEELVDIVGWLAKKYTGIDSTSVTYERANQLMEAVLFSITTYMETKQDRTDTAYSNSTSGKELPVRSDSHLGISARKAYEQGYKQLVQKVKDTIELYHLVLSNFNDYGVACLQDTFIKGIPAFFKWYDVRFNPQNTMLTLDYPVLADMSIHSGIHAIHSYVQCIALEQQFLNALPNGYVTGVLASYTEEYSTCIENICSLVLPNLFGHLLLHSSLTENGFSGEEYKQLEICFLSLEKEQLIQKLQLSLNALCQSQFACSAALPSYLGLCLPDIAARIENAVTYGHLERIIFY